jgi:hypothetical protein
MKRQLTDATLKNFHIILAAIDAGLACPDALDLLQVSHALKEVGELKLATEYERRARRFLPNLQKDLT